MKLDGTMTVGELIAELEQYGDDTPVVMAVEYGDMGRTLQALNVESVDTIDGDALERSGYSHSGLAIAGREDAFGLGDDVVVLS